MHNYQNPVIKGFHPDPSICRNGEDFYLVTSTFEFFPGVPVYHSKNLVDWALMQHCLTTDLQLPLENARNSGGIFAPTIRFHNGCFYMVTTNITAKGNFIVHTDDLCTGWSEPHWVDQGGIDPSLLFDGDKVYFCSTHSDNGTPAIALCEVNPKTGQMLTPSRVISHGSGGKHPEAPHLYKIGAWYYLMLAEGGTEFGHMVTIFRSTHPYGPYEPCPQGPILSHKDFISPIQATGHADIIEDSSGNWWMVCLGIRPIDYKMLHHLGRETFLTPLIWENGWPVVGNNGRIALEMSAPLPGPALPPQKYSFRDDFDADPLHPNWNYVRNPRRERYSLTQRPGWMRLLAGEESLDSKHPTFMGVRQPEFFMQATTELAAELLQEGACAGLSAYYNYQYYYHLCVRRKNGKFFVEAGGRIHGMSLKKKRLEIDYPGQISFRITTGKLAYSFAYSLGDEWIPAGTAATAGLCTEGTMAHTFTGTYLGIFSHNTQADFDSFSLEEIEEQAQPFMEEAP